MLTKIGHLPEEQIKQLALLVKRIISAVSPEKIICFGSRITTMQDWGCFLCSAEYKESIHPTFDLLVIVGEDEKREDHVIAQIVEQQAVPPITVNGIVHKLASVNDALKNGSRFFTGLYHKGLLLYNGGGIPLSTPPEQSDLQEVVTRMQTYWEKEFGLARHFLNAASYSLSSGGPVISAFLLHQATEHTLTALIRVYTAYRCNTHNISKLLALAGTFSMAPMSIFPCFTKEETDLFNRLQKGYSDSRYKDGYNITAEQAATLVERVKDLQATAASLYEEKLQSFTENKEVSFPIGMKQ